MKKDLKRIKTNYTPEVLGVINSLEGPEWDTLPFSIKIEKLLLIALAYQEYWEEHNVFDIINGVDNDSIGYSEDTN